MSLIKIESPTRVDLAGGTLDLWPLYNFVGSAVTVNVAIDVLSRAELELLDSDEVHLVSEDIDLNLRFKSVQELLKSPKPELKIYQPLLRDFKLSGGFRLTTSSQSPVGGGLGGSSSLIISMIKAFSKASGRRFSTNHDIVRYAHNIEAEILNTPTGTQDYYPALSGGLNIIRYDAFGIEQQTFSVSDTPLASHFLLVYTGKAHHSGLNNFEVLQNAQKKHRQTMDALGFLSQVAKQTEQTCLSKDWAKLPELFRDEYKYRIQLCAAFTSPEIEKLHQISLQNGAEAVKICGAGGGGCVLVWVEPRHREKVIQACQKAGFQTMNSRIVDQLPPIN